MKTLLRHCFCIFFFLLVHSLMAQSTATKTGNWGDQGDGTYKNPVLNADYSDPDMIKVGSDFYMVCSDFHFIGMPLLHSKDLVNWTIISQIYTRLDIDPGYSAMAKYGSGSWAPSMRYHNNKFYVYFCTPDEGLYMTTATNPAGPWEPLTEVKRVKGWEDPCPLWDDNGDAYLGHSKLGAGPIIVHRMSPDGKQLLDDGKEIYHGPEAEGTKFYKRNGFYYLMIPEGGVRNGYQTALRSKSIYGPYERKVVLEQGNTKVNGPHQGGMVDLDSGESWFMHFQDDGAIGRVCHLEPVKWVNDWPFIGTDYNNNGIGEPVSSYKKTSVGKTYPATAPQTSDEFSSSTPGLQWQWNHNPVNANWSLTENKGYLSLHALKASNLKEARNTLTQKAMGKTGEVTISLSTKEIGEGQKAGLCLLGDKNHEIGITKINGVLNFYANNDGMAVSGPKVKSGNVLLKIVIDLNTNNTILQYSPNGKTFTQLGKNCELSGSNYWKGIRPALFSYNVNKDGGIAMFDWFHYDNDGPVIK